MPTRCRWSRWILPGCSKCQVLTCKRHLSIGESNEVSPLMFDLRHCRELWKNHIVPRQTTTTPLDFRAVQKTRHLATILATTRAGKGRARKEPLALTAPSATANAHDGCRLPRGESLFRELPVEPFVLSNFHTFGCGRRICGLGQSDSGRADSYNVTGSWWSPICLSLDRIH